MTARRVIHAEPQPVDAPMGRMVGVHIGRREGAPDNSFEVILTVLVAGQVVIVPVGRDGSDAIAEAVVESDRLTASAAGRAN